MRLTQQRDTFRHLLLHAAGNPEAARASALQVGLLTESSAISPPERRLQVTCFCPGLMQQSMQLLHFLYPIMLRRFDDQPLQRPQGQHGNLLQSKIGICCCKP